MFLSFTYRIRTNFSYLTAAYLSAALQTGEMSHVPSSAFSLGALVSQDDFVAGATPGLERFRMVATAIKFTVPPEVDKINQQLLANTADEASRVPQSERSGFARVDCYFPHGHWSSAFSAGAFLSALHLKVSISLSKFNYRPAMKTSQDGSWNIFFQHLLPELPDPVHGLPSFAVQKTLSALLSLPLTIQCNIELRCRAAVAVAAVA